MSKWPKIALGEILQRSDEIALLNSDQNYHEITIKLWGKGVISRGKVSGSNIATPRRFVRANQLVLSKIDARHGAIGIIPTELDGAIVSNDFPSFLINEHDIKPEFLGWLVKSAWFVELCKASSEGTTNRVRIKEDRFLNQRIALPPLTEQNAIVTRLNTIAEKARRVEINLDQIEADAERLLAIRFREAIQDAKWRSMAEVAPVIRRNVKIDRESRYSEIGARSFGKGLFFKPHFDGAEATWQKPVWISKGDLVFSNIKAWEGAISVADAKHDGCIASHRYITCVPSSEKVTSQFLCYYLLTPEGLDKISTASPGTADRNRTLNQAALANIKVPIPPLSKQLAFDELQAKLATIKSKHAETRQSLKALLPSMLEQIFN